MHEQPVSVLVESYTQQEYLEDLLKVTGGNTNHELAGMVINQSRDCLEWMQAHGVHFQPSLSGTLSLARTNAFFLGGGKALVNAYYRTAEKLGVTVLYETEVIHTRIRDNRVETIEVEIAGEACAIDARAVVVAAGGFEANLDWLTQAWGSAAENFLVRGTPYNKGRVLRDLLDQGLVSIGDPTQCHAVAIDGRAPKFDGGIVTRLDCVPFSIVVNKNAERFYNEGEDVWPKRYAIWGRLVAAQPDQVAYAIIDSKSIEHFMPSVFPPIRADSITKLGEQLQLPVDTLENTLATFNNACQPGRFFATELDNLCTQGLEIEKTNWARPINDPPYYAYSLRPGVTFTYLGLKVDEKAHTYNEHGPIENLWAAGEIMAGSILGKGYLAGFGMTIGTVFGRIAGREAAKHVN